MKERLCLMAACLCLIGGSSLNAPVSADTGYRPPVGKECRVQFRRDLLGVQSANGIGTYVQNQKGADVVLTGKLISFDKEYVVLSTEGSSQFHIPITSVLYFESLPPAAEKSTP